MEAKKIYDNIDEKLNPKLEQMEEEIEDNIMNQANKLTENLTDCHKKIKSRENEFLMEEKFGQVSSTIEAYYSNLY